MKTDWRKFPDNIGHLYYRGCFRCHDGKHVNEQERSFEGLQHVPHHLAQFEDDTLRISQAASNTGTRWTSGTPDGDELQRLPRLTHNNDNIRKLTDENTTPDPNFQPGKRDLLKYILSGGLLAFFASIFYPVLAYLKRRCRPRWRVKS